MIAEGPCLAHGNQSTKVKEHHLSEWWLRQNGLTQMAKWGVVRRRMCQQIVGTFLTFTMQDAANQRVIKLEATLRAMEDYDGPKVATLKSSLQKARAVSKHSFLVTRNGCNSGRNGGCGAN